MFQVGFVTRMIAGATPSATCPPAVPVLLLSLGHTAVRMIDRVLMASWVALMARAARAEIEMRKKTRAKKIPKACVGDDRW